MDYSLIVGLAFSVPLALAVNLLTPLSQRGIANVNRRYRERLAIKVSKEDEYVRILVKNPTLFTSEMVNSSAAVTQLTIAVAGFGLTAVSFSLLVILEARLSSNPMLISYRVVGTGSALAAMIAMIAAVNGARTANRLRQKVYTAAEWPLDVHGVSSLCGSGPAQVAEQETEAETGAPPEDVHPTTSADAGYRPSSSSRNSSAGPARADPDGAPGPAATALAAPTPHQPNYDDPAPG